jgi:tetratricopeptide (TPR) repeat protein
MIRMCSLVVALALGAAAAGADTAAVLAEADALHDAGSNAEAIKLLEGALAGAATGGERAEIHWRISRAWLNAGEQAEAGGAGERELLALFEKGETAGQRAIDENPRSPLGYYWKAANTGRWGQAKGILNALARARPMRDLLRRAIAIDPLHADSYYVMGQLYEAVPGPPVSFGDKDAAVSLGRYAVELRQRDVAAGREKALNYDAYTELAKHLWDRNWSGARRAREQGKKRAEYTQKSDPVDKAFVYEALVKLSDESDRDEARALVSWAIRELEARPARTASEQDDLKEARGVLAGWK